MMPATNDQNRGRAPSPALPVSLALGGGGVRGIAHLGVLEVLLERGFAVREMVGTSVGALILGYYAGVGLGVDALREVGLEMTSRNLVCWGLSQRLPARARGPLLRRSGVIPDYVARLEVARWDRLHFGVERIGVVAYDPVRREEVLYHSGRPVISVADAARGAAAFPFVFRPRVCTEEGRTRVLVDGGLSNPFPVDALFAGPFRPVQVVAVDISSAGARRGEHRAKVDALRARHPDVPIALVTPDTLGRRTILYRNDGLSALVAAGRRAAEAALGPAG
jgi:NTE family protein